MATSPPSDPGRFDLAIDGQVKKANAGNGDTTGKQAASVMYHRVRVTDTPASVGNHYSTTMTCKDQGGAGQTVPDTSFFDGQGWLPVASASDIVCTILKTRHYPPSQLSVSQSRGIVQASWTLPSPPPPMLTGLLEFAPSPYTNSDGSFSHGLTISYVFDSDGRRSTRLRKIATGDLLRARERLDPTECDIPGICPEFWSPPVTLVVPEPLPITDRAPLATSTAPPPAKPAVADKATAFSSLLVPPRQRLRELYVQAAMGEPGTISVRGRVRAGKQARSYRFKAVSAPAVPGTSVRLRLNLPRKASVAVRKALRRQRKIRATITITATDAAGNVKQEKRRIRLRL